MTYSSWVSNGTNVAYEPKEKNTGEVITSFSTTAPGGVPNSSYAPSTYVLAASGAWIAQTVATAASEVRRPSVYTELTGNPSPYFIATNTNLVYDADANHITTYGAFELAGLQVQNDASFTYTVFQTKAQTWTSCTLNISRNYASTQWTSGTEARFYLSTDSGSNWALLLTDDYDSDPITVAIFSHTLATVNPSSLSAYQVKVEIDAFPSSAFNSVGVLYLQLYDIWIEGIYAVSGGSGTVTSITTTGANGVTISGGSTQTITTSGTFALALGAITPTSIATGTGSFSGDVEFASSIKSPNASNSPVTIAPDGTGDVHLNTDSIRIGDNNADATIATRGTGDLIITTHEGSAVEGIVRLYDGANGNITLTPNGSGQVKVGTDQVVTLVASQTLTNKTISGSSNTLSNIANASLTNSTISGVALGSNLNALTISSPLTGTSYNGSSAVSIGIPVATTSVNGYLSSTDWTTFNNKGSGSVTSVAATVPSLLSISGSPITTSGTLAITYSGTALPVANGGTGLTTLTAGYIPYGAGTSAFGSSANLFWDSANSNLGIGTAAPYNKVEIEGASARLGLNNGGGASRKALLIEPLGYGGNTYARLESYDYGTSTGGILALNVTGGNVGIGTASPVVLKSATTLQVYGNIKVGNDNARGLISLGDVSSTGANAGIWRGAAGAYGSTGNYLCLGGYDGITFTTGNAEIASQTERMRIDSSGNVGIGTTSISQKLTFANTGMIGWNSVNGTVKAGSGGGNDYIALSGDGSSDHLVVKYAGNVGIGTASPAFKLDVQGSSAGYLEAVRFKNTNAAGYLTTSWAVGSAEATIRYAPSILFKIGPDSGDTTTPIVFATNNGTERVRIDSSGNVGIGVTPTVKFEVLGNALIGPINGKMFIGDVGHGANYPALAHQSYANTNGYALLAPDNGYLFLNKRDVASTYIGFRKNNADMMVINNDGNVGIGTTSPTNKLQVNGVMVGNNAAGSYTKGFGGILTTTSTSTPTGGSSGDFALIY